MKRYVTLKEIEIQENGKRKVISKTSIPYVKARSLSLDYRQQEFDTLTELGGKQNMPKDHYIYCGEVYGPRGGFKELHHFLKGKDMTDEEFYKFIRIYSYVGAYHK